MVPLQIGVVRAVAVLVQPPEEGLLVLEVEVEELEVVEEVEVEEVEEVNVVEDVKVEVDNVKVVGVLHGVAAAAASRACCGHTGRWEAMGCGIGCVFWAQGQGRKGAGPPSRCGGKGDPLPADGGYQAIGGKAVARALRRPPWWGASRGG